MLNPAESLAGGLQRQSWRSNSSLVQDEADREAFALTVVEASGEGERELLSPAN